MEATFFFCAKFSQNVKNKNKKGIKKRDENISKF
jgi:hypothetical protein